MLIDLGRNDVGRVAEIGSVELTENMLVERYSHVMHIVSHVEGNVRRNKRIRRIEGMFARWDPSWCAKSSRDGVN